MPTMPQPVARCWFCETLLSDDDARLIAPAGTLAALEGRIFGPCCQDLMDDTDWVMAE